ncbi:hypothetical protein GNF80_10090 [Clostridium perfringens]|nr:hypothetical protein [Clostridium perfringens]
MNKEKDNIEAILEEYGQTIPVPIELLINPIYNKCGNSDRLRHNSIILYGLLSSLPKEKDTDGKEYVSISGNKIAELVGTTTSSVPTKMIKQLEDFNLVERKESKKGQPYKLYVKEITR